MLLNSLKFVKESAFTQVSHEKLELNIQVLICTDYSVFQLHANILSHNNWTLSDMNQKQIVVQHIKQYYITIIKDVNERYQNSFKDDPLLNIKLAISGFIIATVEFLFLF